MPKKILLVSFCVACAVLAATLAIVFILSSRESGKIAEREYPLTENSPSAASATENEPVPTASSTVAPSENTEINILFAGDLMLDRGVEYYVNKLAAGDSKFPFEKAAEYLNSFDAVITNLEGPVSDKGVLSGSIYSFRMSPSVLAVFPYANIKAVNVANNHAWDYGRDAFEDTLARLKENNIGYFGGGKSENEAYSPYIFEKNGIKIAILGFTEFLESVRANGNEAGIAFSSPEKMEAAIKAAKQKTNIVIAQFHFGEEYRETPVERQVNIARAAIDAGADIVIGHHPHVVETSEEYKGKMIFYSLGNFVFDQGFSKETMSPGLLEVGITANGIEKAVLRQTSLTKYFELLPPEK